MLLQGGAVGRYREMVFTRTEAEKALDHEKELDHSFMAVTIENKLNSRMKNEFSVEYTKDDSKDKQ